jgi:hypothetical protein
VLCSRVVALYKKHRNIQFSRVWPHARQFALFSPGCLLSSHLSYGLLSFSFLPEAGGMVRHWKDFSGVFVVFCCWCIGCLWLLLVHVFSLVSHWLSSVFNCSHSFSLVLQLSFVVVQWFSLFPLVFMSL